MIAADLHTESLPRGFFARSAVAVAPELLGAQLMRRFPDGVVVSGCIVETEAYLQDDPACHAFRGCTPRNRTMFGAAGHAYIHSNYGIHWCVNVVAGEVGVPEAVLIRAVEPSTASFARLWSNYDSTPTGAKDRRIGAGPGRLGKAFGISRALDGVDLTDPTGPLFVTHGSPVPAEEIVVATRIGITKATDYPWRFYDRRSSWVSRTVRSARFTP